VSPAGGQHLVADDHLRHAGRVAKIQERHPAVIPTRGDPPGQGNDLSGVVAA
jgi:hypothetical protein